MEREPIVIILLLPSILAVEQLTKSAIIFLKMSALLVLMVTRSQSGKQLLVQVIWVVIPIKIFIIAESQVNIM